MRESQQGGLTLSPPMSRIQLDIMESESVITSRGIQQCASQFVNLLVYFNGDKDV